MGFKTGGETFHESYYKDVFDLLGQQSPWKSYVWPNMDPARKSLKSFQVLPEKDFYEKTKVEKGAAGWTDKTTGIIYMLEWGKPGYTYVLAALHEFVHLCSDPAKQGAESSSLKILLRPMNEALVECVAEDVLTAQSIALPSDKLRGYVERLVVMRSLIDPDPPGAKNKNLELFAKTLFKGDSHELLAEMEAAYGHDGWLGIKGAFAHPEIAVKNMQSSRQKQQEKSQTNAGSASAPSL